MTDNPLDDLTPEQRAKVDEIMADLASAIESDNVIGEVKVEEVGERVAEAHEALMREAAERHGFGPDAVEMVDWEVEGQGVRVHLRIPRALRDVLRRERGLDPEGLPD